MNAFEYFGACDASGAQPIGKDMFIVGNDEDNVLRVYKLNNKKPIAEINLDKFLDVDISDPELDIEGTAKLGEYIYWIASHGNSKKGRYQESRHRLFATKVTVAGEEVVIAPVGKPYTNLLKDLINAPQLKPFNFEKGSHLSTGNRQSVNIEGLAGTPQGALLLAFRTPIPNGKALIVPVENPEAIIQKGQSAQIGQPALLDLDGRGIRAMEYIAQINEYLIVGGHYDNDGIFKLYRWSGNPKDKPRFVRMVDKDDIVPETFAFYGDGRLQIISDDGTRKIDGKQCKQTDEAVRRFRTYIVNI